MAETKKKLEEDVTKNPQAKTEQDVNNQDTATRLWQSLKTTYGNQMEESDKAYDRAISQQSNADLARGMGRSSYASQIRAGMYNDKATARNKLGESLIADYQNRLNQLEEAEAARKFQTSEREAQQAWQSGENALAREGQKELQTMSQNWQSGENALNRAFTTSEREATQAYTTGEREASQAYSTSEREAQQKYNTSEREATQKWQSGESDKSIQAQKDLQESSQKWQSGENALNRAFTTQERIASENFQTNLTKLQQEFQASESSKAQQAQKDLQLLQQAWQSGENKLSREAQEALQRLQIEANKEENKSNQEFQKTMQELQQAFTAKENAANRALTQQQIDEQHLQNTIANQQWQQSFNAQQEQNTIQNEQWQQSFNAQQAQNEIQNAFNEKQLQMQQDRWKAEFDYNEKSNLQKISMEKVMAIIQNGNDPDDTLLGQAGMTRAEANGMKAQVTSWGGGSTSNPGAGTPDWQTAGYDSAEDMAEAQDNGYTNANEWKAYKLLNEGKGIWSGLPGNVQSGGTTQSTSDDTNNRLKNITRRT